MDIRLVGFIFMIFHNMRCESWKGPLLTSQDVKVRVYQHKNNLIKELIETSDRIRENVLNEKNNWVESLEKSVNDSSLTPIVSNKAELTKCPAFEKLDAKLNEIKLSYTDLYNSVLNETGSLLKQSIDLCLPGSPTYSAVSVRCEQDVSSMVEDRFKPLHEAVNNYTGNIPLVMSMLQRAERSCVGLVKEQVQNGADTLTTFNMNFSVVFSILFTSLMKYLCK